MNDYLPGVIPWIRGRAEMLHTRLDPTKHDPALQEILGEQQGELVAIIGAAEKKLENPTLCDPEYADNHLADYRSWVRDVNDIETIFLPLCELWGDNERDMQQVLHNVVSETAMPSDVRKPVIALYGASYEVETTTGIIFAPRMERDFLLHLPDLYHELAHLIVEEHWETLWVNVERAIANHFDPLIRKGKAIHDPHWKDETYQRSQNCWFDKWLVEFTCDAIATLLCGPAYAWAHLHLCASHSDVDLYQGSETHPADHARFQLISAVLEHLGESEQRAQFSTRWHGFTATQNQPRPASFDSSYPESLIGLLIQEIHDGMVTLNMRTYDGAAPQDAPTAALLNEAWAAFWSDPAAYRSWEVAANGRLRGTTT